jgi:hypothetical protein
LDRTARELVRAVWYNRANLSRGEAMATTAKTDWVTTAEAAKLSGYTADYVRELIRAGVIVGNKWSSDWQVSRQSLLTYLNEQAAKGKRRGRKRCES